MLMFGNYIVLAEHNLESFSVEKAAIDFISVSPTNLVTLSGSCKLQTRIKYLKTVAI